ncbi:MAG: right-handed parallel beta-helix repeat-containing protein [Bacteroidetes bacterium]|nr:right-handed parallel beta-helix repeat-containing protein [Bacteroidota bacterium]
MKYIFTSIFTFIVILFLACNIEPVNTFYIDSEIGNDTNSGQSPKKAWKSLNPLMKKGIEPGTKILLRGNLLYEGNITFDSVCGLLGKPIVFSTFGKGRAILNAGDTSGLLFSRCSFLEISNISVIGSGRLNGNNGNGLELSGCKEVKIDSIDAHGFMWSGIHIVRGENIRLNNITSYENGFCGILVESGEPEYGLDGSKFKTMRNIYIGNSKAYNNPGCPLIKDNHSGNGILMAGVVNGVIEFCEAYNNGWDMPRDGNGPVGIWAYMSDSITIQYCYSHHNKTSLTGKDGGGFDFDGGITNSIMQYNISANNEGAGYGIFQYAGATAWANNLLRNNISYNDGFKNGKSGIFMWYDPVALPMKNFKALNNLIISNQPYAVNFDPGKYENFIFQQNIFLLTGPYVGFAGGSYNSAGFIGNTYWHSDGNKMNSQPPIHDDAQANLNKPDIDYLNFVDEDVSVANIKPLLVKYGVIR